MTAPDGITWHGGADATVHRATYASGMPAAVVRQTHPDAWGWWAWDERGRRIGLGGGYAKIGEAMATAEHVIANSGAAVPVTAPDDAASPVFHLCRMERAHHVSLATPHPLRVRCLPEDGGCDAPPEQPCRVAAEARAALAEVASPPAAPAFPAAVSGETLAAFYSRTGVAVSRYSFPLDWTWDGEAWRASARRCECGHPAVHESGWCGVLCSFAQGCTGCTRIDGAIHGRDRPRSTVDMRIASIDLDAYRRGWEDGQTYPVTPEREEGVSYILGHGAGKLARETAVAWYPRVLGAEVPR